jgi:site-specific DNA-methyltransferase (adenine-specific)
MGKNSHLYMFCDPDTLWHAVPSAEAAGFRFWKPIVWDKLTLGIWYHYRRQYEFSLFFEKGKRRLQDLGFRTCFALSVCTAVTRRRSLWNFFALS